MSIQLTVTTRCDDSTDGIEARIHDPLWLLARQWQLGELKGDDAGSPIGARISMEVAPISVWQSRSAAGVGVGNILSYQATQKPLEAWVEAECWDIVAFPNHRLSAETGLRLQRLLSANGLGEVINLLRSTYALVAPSGMSNAQDPATIRYMQVMNGRVLDGLSLYRLLMPLMDGASLKSLPAGVPFSSILSDARGLTQNLLARWLVECRQFTGGNISAASVVGAAPAWQRERMEYAFAVGAQLGDQPVTLAAPEYFEGDSDWFTFMVDTRTSSNPAPANLLANYGSVINIAHAQTGTRLHSHMLSYVHPGTSGQQQVTAFAGADDNDLWRIKGPHGQPDNMLMGKPVRDGDVIRLEHVLTRGNLHSHSGWPSPVTKQQEVTCYGNNGTGDSNDNWRLEIEGGGAWLSASQVRLVHANSNVVLSSNAGVSHAQWTAGQLEVAGATVRDGNSWWTLTKSRPTQVFLPTPVQFQGMPSARFWELEDARLNLPHVDGERTDIASRLFLDFILRYSNDWFVLPLKLPTGSISRVASLIITNNFGEHMLVKHINDGEPNTAWKMFSLSMLSEDQSGAISSTGASAHRDLFLLPATLGQVLESAPVEKVRLLRDEMANVGWAVEMQVESATGQVIDRFEEYQLHRASQKVPPAAANGLRRYRLGSPVPDFWVPLLPIAPGQDGIRRLERAGVPQIENDKIVGVLLPQSRLMEPGVQLRIYDEEVPREGVEVIRRYRLARAADGSQHLWIGRSKRPGQGEGSSGLRFDTVEFDS